MVVGTEKVSSNLTMFEVPPSAMAAETEGEGMYGLPDKFIVFQLPEVLRSGQGKRAGMHDK